MEWLVGWWIGLVKVGEWNGWVDVFCACRLKSSCINYSMYSELRLNHTGLAGSSMRL